MSLAGGPGIGIAAILTAIRARNQAALEEARQRREDQDFALHVAAQQAAQQNARTQTDMQRTNNQRLFQREQFREGQAQDAAAEKAKNDWLSDASGYEQSKERGVPEASRPAVSDLRSFATASPEQFDKRLQNPQGSVTVGGGEDAREVPLSDVRRTEGEMLERQKASTMDALAAKADELARRNLGDELRKKATAAPRVESPNSTRRADLAEANATRVPPQDRREVTGYRNTMRNLDRMDKGFDDAAQRSGDPNFAKMRINDALRYFGANDVDLTVLKARNINTLAQYIFTISGKAVTEGEYSRLAQVLVNDTDTVDSARGKIREFQSFLREKKQDTVNALRDVGYKVPANWDGDFDQPVQNLATKPGTIPGATRR